MHAERGAVFVPVRRSDPHSQVIRIEYHRFDAAPGVPAGRPPIFVLPGGPGFPGLGDALQEPGFYERELQPLTGVADVVVVGQRGIGTSWPNTACPPMPPVPHDRAVRPYEVASLLATTMQTCRAFWEGQGLDLQGFTVVEAAADVDDVRRALGYDTITLWGGSFGSHWAMATLRAHPEIVSRAVLAGLEGPDHTYDRPSGVLSAIRGFAAAADGAEALQGHIPEGGLLEAFTEVVARLEADPVTVSITVGDEATDVWLGADEVRELSLGVTASASSRRGIATWPRDVAALHRGDYTAAAERVHDERSGGWTSTASFFMLDCGSGITAERLAELQVDPAIAVVGDLSWFYHHACASWDSDLGDAFRGPFVTSIPTVIVQGDWDTSTPYGNAVELAPWFTDHRFVTVRGGSHQALREAMEADADLRDAVLAFAATGAMEALPAEVSLPPIEWVVPD